jgi:hypothetical protein
MVLEINVMFSVQIEASCLLKCICSTKREEGRKSYDLSSALGSSARFYTLSLAPRYQTELA